VACTLTGIEWIRNDAVFVPGRIETEDGMLKGGLLKSRVALLPEGPAAPSRTIVPDTSIPPGVLLGLIRKLISFPGTTVRVRCRIVPRASAEMFTV